MVDVESIIDPLHQIVPTLLDVPYTTDEVVAPRPTSEEEDRLVTTSLQDSSEPAAEVTPSSTDTQQNINVDSATVESVDSATVESADQLKSSADPLLDPVEYTSDIVSVPDVTSESETDTRDVAESEET